MAFVIQESGILTPQNVSVRLPHPVAEMIDLGDWAIVRMQPPPKEPMNRNVMALNADGSIRYQLPNVAVPPEADHPYLRISLVDRVLEAYNYNGVLVKADPATGHVEFNDLVK